MPPEQLALLLAKADQDEYVLDKFLDDAQAPVEIFGFHAQQAVEKLFKAALVAAGSAYPQTHRLAELIDLIRNCGVDLPDEFEELRYLTPFAVEFRYDIAPEEEEEPLDKVLIRRLVADLRSWVESFVEQQTAREGRKGSTGQNDSIDLRRLPGAAATDVMRGQGYFPVIASPDGRACLVVHRAGAGHLGLGGHLEMVRSPDGGTTWEAPTPIVDSHRDDRNPAWGFTPDGTLVLAYLWQGSYDDQGQYTGASGPTDTKLIYSADRGCSWTGETALDYPPLSGASPYGKIRCAADGALYMPIYGGAPLPGLTGYVEVAPAATPTYLLRSTDQGQSWGAPILVALGLNEADLLFLPDGDWLFAARSEEDARLYTCRSVDQGQTWGDLQAVTAPSEHPPDLTLLGDGSVLLLFGHRHPPYGVQGLRSRDGGRTWDARRLLLADDLPGQDTGYPSTVRLDGGRLVTVYYSAGTREQPHDSYRALDVYCRALCYDEESLLAVWD